MTQIAHIRNYKRSEGWLDTKDPNEIKEVINNILLESGLKDDLSNKDTFEMFKVAIISGNPKFLVENSGIFYYFNPAAITIWINISERCIISIISNDLNKEWFKYLLITSIELFSEINSIIIDDFIELYFLQ